MIPFFSISSKMLQTRF